LDLDPAPDPDPLVRGTDPGIRIRIRNNMSRIPNTAFKYCTLKKEVGYCEVFAGFLRKTAAGIKLQLIIIQ